jgi:membrane protein DedA with SNARE-associated domain
MWEEILKAIPIYLLCTLKVVFGPTLGYAAGLNIITTMIATASGMMTSVVAFTYFGEWLRMKLLNKWISTRKKFTPNNRRIVTVWKKFGLAGIAVLTPLGLTPIGGTILAVSLGAPKEKIIFFMLISSIVFAVVGSTLIYVFGDAVLPEFIKP